MPVLFEKSGAEGTYRRFKFEILKIIQENDVPGFLFGIRTGSATEPIVHMVRRDRVGEGGAQSWVPPRPKSQPRVHTRDAADTPDLPLLSRLNRALSERTIAQLRAEFPGWDIYALQADFNEWLNQDASRTPANYDAAFYGWVRKHHTRNKTQLS